MELMDIRRMLMTMMMSGGGGGDMSSYTLLGSKEVTVSTSSTTEIAVDDMSFTGSNLDGKILFATIRDKYGKKDSYFYGGDQIFKTDSSYGTISTNYGMRYIGTGNYGGVTISTGTTGYGVYIKSISVGSGTASIVAKYQSSSSKTINGTYIVKLYALEWPDNSCPFN